MTGNPSSSIAWREPLRARARVAFEEFRRRWYLPVGAGAGLALLGFTLLVIWAYSLSEPLNLRATAVMFAFGLLVIFLLTLDDFLPHAIKLSEKGFRISQPSMPVWIRYPDLGGCDLTPGADPQFRGFGRASEPLFAVFLDPDIDPERLRGFLLARGITFSATPPDSSSIQRTRLFDPSP